ncbi:MAG: signal transduction protein [Frankiales bacterium]|nr:signal transduction protein [Frankiales bacterium]
MADQDTTGQVVSSLEAHVQALYDALERAQVGLEQALAADEVDVEQRTSEELTEYLRGAFRPLAAQLLSGQSSGHIAGTGALVDAGPAASRQLSMVWWVRRNEVVSEKRHNLNPASDAFYDFRVAPWFSTPQRTGRPALTGPYIDAWGLDDLTITAAVPLTVKGEVVGVVALDVAIPQFVADLSQELQRLDVDAAVVNAEQRIVASTAPELTTGLPLTSRAQAAATQSPATASYPLCGQGWALVLLAPEGVNN